MRCKSIFEIGPIGSYTENSRKTRDLWGSSFLFSYMMGVVANIIGGKNIISPSIENDPLFKYLRDGKGKKIVAGTINDQIICVHDDQNLPERVKSLFEKTLRSLFWRCITKQRKFITEDEWKRIHDNRNAIDGMARKQINNFFRLFHVTIDNCNDKDNAKERDTLLRASSSRGKIYTFDSFSEKKTAQDGAEIHLSKFDKCSLCGDREKLITLSKTRRNDRDEGLCAICTIKRGLINAKKGMIRQDPAFKSTTAIAAKYIINIMRTSWADDGIKAAFYTFFDSFIKGDYRDEDLELKDYETIESITDDLEGFLTTSIFGILDIMPYQFLFTDQPPAVELRHALKEYCKKSVDIDIKSRTWIDNTYYAIVTTDGDNTGTLFGKYPDKQGKISENIAKFNEDASDIIDEAKGQLIYAGGEDILFLVHPSDVFDVLIKLNNAFNKKIGKAIDEKYDISKNEYTISAGVYICKHKHPLKLAVQGAHVMIDAAKNLKDNEKGFVKVNLVKGQGENGCMTLKIPDNGDYSVSMFNDLIGNYSGKKIPRGFLYKFEAEADLYSRISKDKSDFVQCIKNLCGKTRDSGMEYTYISDLVDKSIVETGDPEKKIEYKELRERLYMARFFTGGLE